MWMLSLLTYVPDFLIYGIMALSVVGLLASFFLSKLPFISTYTLPIKIGSALALVITLWLAGFKSNEAMWQARVTELQEKIAAAEQQSKEENIKIQTKVVTKIELVRQRGEDIVKYVDREVVKYDDQCKIPTEFINALNQAAEPPK